MTSSTPWIVRPVPRPSARLRLFCFPHAGGGASFFRDWPARLPADIEVLAVQPPGREERLHEPAFSDLASLVEATLAALRPQLTPPYALFGHSMGALLAYEMARRLFASDAPPPVHLAVSAWTAPTLSPGRRESLQLLPDAELRARLRAWQGTPAEVLDHDDLMNALLPTLRADFAVCARATVAEPLPCPLSAFGGSADPTASRADLESWRGLTASTFTIQQFPGHHFYLKSCPEFFTALSQMLLQALDGRPALQSGEVHVWRASLDLGPEFRNRLAECLSPAEQARAAGFHFAADRERFRAAHGVLRSILGQYLAMPPAEVPMVSGPAGKPALGSAPLRVAAQPVPPLRFNLSHSGSQALAAVTLGDDVGVDLEQLRPVADALGIAERYFAPAESAALVEQPADQREQAFLRCWTRKEAFLKARGTGLSFGLDRFAVSCRPPSRGWLLWVDGEPDAAAHWWLEDVPVGPDYLAALAVRRPAATLRLWNWDPASFSPH